ncbi:MAG TPA: metallophosphoesterase family protein [Amycolatopsis sp.]|nr:metallophosphoesterase family protein [Amycolatopsis sp.]
MHENDAQQNFEGSPTGDEGVSRRGFFGRTLAAGVTLGAAGLVESEVVDTPAAAADVAEPTSLPTTTEPEQLHLTWGSDPAGEVTVSWASPGTVAQPAPRLAYSKRPITTENPGKVVALPAPKPLDQRQLRTGPEAISFTDGVSGQTTYHYHVPLRNLEPDTTYYYQVSDGAATSTTAGASFTTAPRGRFKFRFSSFGDVAEPSAFRSASGESLGPYLQDTSYFTVGAIENPGDGGGAPLFHLVNGDLSYANDIPHNHAAIWRDYSANVSRSAKNRPWLPTLGNHEVEGGNTDLTGRGAGGLNGPYGHGSYLARFLLPPNGVTNYDGNQLQGHFYSFQVGTVCFIAADADDVVFQPTGINGYTGDLVPQAGDYSLVAGGSRPNLQTQWLERTLRAARNDPTVDMIVMHIHQCPLSSDQGNGTDLGLRQAWLPLFDKYEVDLVLSGHEHVFERSYPVRGYDNGDYGTVMKAFTTAEGVSYPVGSTFNTRRPTVVSTGPTATVNGEEVFDTSKGTVYYILGGGGASSTYGYSYDPGDGLRKARVWTALDPEGPEYGGNQAWEDAPWSAQVDSGDAHGYAIFDVDPGRRPGETTITVQWFQLPTVAPGATPVMPTTPYSKVTYGRSARWVPGHH